VGGWVRAGAIWSTAFPDLSPPSVPDSAMRRHHAAVGAHRGARNYSRRVPRGKNKPNRTPLDVVAFAHKPSRENGQNPKSHKSHNTELLVRGAGLIPACSPKFGPNIRLQASISTRSAWAVQVHELEGQAPAPRPLPRDEARESRHEDETLTLKQKDNKRTTRGQQAGTISC